MIDLKSAAQELPTGVVFVKFGPHVAETGGGGGLEGEVLLFHHVVKVTPLLLCPKCFAPRMSVVLVRISLFSAVMIHKVRCSLESEVISIPLECTRN